MKTYKFVLRLRHESFGGYEHNDGTKEFVIEARDTVSARNKLKKLAKDYNTGRRWYTIESISCDD